MNLSWYVAKANVDHTIRGQRKGRPDLQSNNSIILEIPKTNLISYGNSAFYNAAPVLWNGLTDDLRNTEKLNTFKSTIKT